MTLRHGSLFSGIGGFDLAAEWVGWKNVFHCEWNDFGQKVLKYYWPEAESYGDITKTDFTKWRGSVDIISGGFPCQPYSSAGKRLGKEDERHLWPHMLRAIREAAPSFVVGENVRGLTNWNGGVVFDEVQTDLEALGYQVAAFLIPAAGVNAPHGRDRIWFVAYSNGRGRWREKGLREHDLRGSKGKKQDHYTEQTDQGLEQRQKNRNATNASSLGFCGNGTTEQSQPETFGTRDGMGSENAANTDSRGTQSQQNLRQTVSSEKRTNSNGGEWDAADSESVCLQGQRNGQRKGKFRRSDWCRFPTQSPICGGDDGLPTQLDGITFPKWRNESIKAYGNAIVPQVAYQIFKTIEQTKYENY